MGIWDYVNGGLKNTRYVTKVASESAVWMSQKVVERMPDQEGWKRIGQLGWRIADHALDRGTKAFTGGLPVYKFVKEELSKKKNSQYKPSKNESTTELVKLKAIVQNLQKKNMELEKQINGLGLGLGLVGLVLLILKIKHNH
ncbi:uncharacterized protein LOC144564331 [Carex rostrata]